jgi:branched-chain amino acid transport system permease protein
MSGGKSDVATVVAKKKKVTPLRIALWALVGVALVVVPILFEGFQELSFLTRILGVVGLYVLLALGLNIVVGYAGLLDLGYIAFYAIGAYAGVIVGSWAFAHAPTLGPFIYFLMIPVAAAFAALAGIALGTPVLRLRGDYLAIVTLGFGEIVRIVITNDIFGLTNGAAGLPRATETLAKPAGLKWLEDHVYVSLPHFGPNGFTFAFSSNLYWYYIIVLLCMLAIFVILRLDNSRLGRSWAALREDEIAASSMGISITKTKLWAFSLGALWGGIAGVTFANYQQFVTPESFSFMESVFVVAVVVIGGMASIPGVIVGALFIQGVPELIRGFAQSGLLGQMIHVQIPPETVTAITSYRNLVFGLFMVVMMIWRPQGIIPSKRRAAELQPECDEIAEVESETLYDAQHDSGEPPGMNQF